MEKEKDVGRRYVTAREEVACVARANYISELRFVGAVDERFYLYAMLNLLFSEEET